MENSLNNNIFDQILKLFYSCNNCCKCNKSIINYLNLQTMNKIQNVIKGKETEVFKFVPNRPFYAKIGINRKRFGLIMRNELQPTYSELQSLAKYFEVELNTLVEE